MVVVVVVGGGGGGARGKWKMIVGNVVVDWIFVAPSRAVPMLTPSRPIFTPMT